MKGKRRLFGVLLIIAALIIMQLPVSEADAATSASDFQMEGTKLVRYRGTDTRVSIPDTVEVIAESAFEENDKIELVVIPDSVKRIEAFAFWGCDNLDSAVLGKGLIEVGDYSFANCKGLEQMTIPENIRSIGIQAFADCVNMTDITIPPQVTAIHETAFDGCYKLYIHCEAGSYADKYAEEFYKKQKEMPEYEDVSDYQTPDTPEDDNTEDSGSNSNATYVPEVNVKDEGNLLGSTKVVGNRAVVFIDNTSPTVLGEGNSSQGDISDNEPITNTKQETEQGTLPKYTIVDGRVVADQAYYKNKTLKQVSLPQGIEEIGQFAFARSSLTDIVIPEGVKRICYGAFYHVDNLADVSLPTTIENVEPKAFTYSSWVENFIKNGSDSFLISGNVLVAYRGAGEEVVIPDGVTVIAGEAFMNHMEIKSVTLPESLLTIGEGAFEDCNGLTEINIGTQLLRIKDRAFAGCPLKEVSLPASVSELGLKVFDEGVNVIYEGEKSPIMTYETSAERLSNEKYRPITTEDGEIGVKVTGVEPAFASLEGANRSYTLSVAAVEDISQMRNAYHRAYQTEIPQEVTVYDLQLTDNSGIPLTKLGKQMLTVVLPVPETYAQENVVVYTLDRNGQLERLESERVLLEGADAVRFQTTHLALFSICGDGSSYNADDVLEVSTTLQSMSAAPNNANNGVGRIDYLVYFKWILVIALLSLGTVNVLRESKR